MILYILTCMIGVALSTLIPLLAGADTTSYSFLLHYLIGLVFVLLSIPYLYEEDEDPDTPTIQFSDSARIAAQRLKDCVNAKG